MKKEIKAQEKHANMLKRARKPLIENNKEWVEKKINNLDASEEDKRLLRLAEQAGRALENENTESLSNKEWREILPVKMGTWPHFTIFQKAVRERKLQIIPKEVIELKDLLEKVGYNGSGIETLGLICIEDEKEEDFSQLKHIPWSRFGAKEAYKNLKELKKVLEVEELKMKLPEINEAKKRIEKLIKEGLEWGKLKKIKIEEGMKFDKP